MGNINSHHVSLNINKKRVEFRFEEFFGGSLNEAGISFQILAPTLEKALFWIPRPSVIRVNTSSIAE